MRPLFFFIGCYVTKNLNKNLFYPDCQIFSSFVETSLSLDIWQIFQRTNFLVNKAQGSYLTVPEFIDVIDRAQVALYSEYQSRIGTSEEIEFSLSPFKYVLDFTPSSFSSGVLNLNPRIYDILDLRVLVVENGHTFMRPVDFPNEDEIAYRLSSQLIPNSATNPFAQIISKDKIVLHPKTGAYTGTIVTYVQPTEPVLNTALVSGRVLVYIPVGSIQLQWSDKDINTIIIRALSDMGINMSAEDVQAWADKKINSPIKE